MNFRSSKYFLKEEKQTFSNIFAINCGLITNKITAQLQNYIYLGEVKFRVRLHSSKDSSSHSK